MCARRPGDVAVADRGCCRDCAAERYKRSTAGFEGIHKPTPRNFGQQRIGGQGFIEIGLDVGNQAHGAVPGLVAVRVEKQNEPTEGVAFRLLGNSVRIGMEYLGADRVAVRRKSLWRADRTDFDLGPDLC